MVKYFNQPKTKTKQGTPGDTGVVSPATPAASASTVGTAATQSQPTENGGNPATTQPQQTAAAPQTTRRPLSNEYIQMKAQFDYDKANPMKFENLPKPDERIPTGNAYEPEEVVDFTNPKFAQKPAEFTPNIPGAEEGERQMRYIGPYDEGTYNYLGLQADMGNIPEAAIYQDAFDQVYGDKPGFVATDDRDGGFYEWARNVVDPEELREAQKENKTRMGIIALADALRHFGNIYHTTKGAPAQTLTNATEKEYARQQQEEQLAIERLQKQYESEMKRLDLQYKRAMEEQRYKDSQEIKRMQLELQKSQQEALERYREQQQENWDKKFDADQEYRAGQQDLAQQRIYLSGGRGGGGSRGGGGRRSGGGRTVRGGGGKYRVSGGGGKGGSKGTDGGEVKYTFEVPDSIARKQGDKDAYVEEAYKSLVKAGYATAGKRSIATKKEEIEKQLHDPAVRETLQLAGITVYENGAVAAGRKKISSAWNGGGQATGGRSGSGSTAASGGAAARGSANGNGQTGRTGQAGKPVSGGQRATGQGAKQGGAGQNNWQYTATEQAQGVYNQGSKGGSKGGSAGGRSTSANGGNASRGVVTSRGGGASRASDRLNPTYSIGGSGVSIHIPLRVSNVKTGKRDTQVPLNTLEQVYNAGVKRGWIGAGAKTYSDMVDAIYDNLDNIHVSRMLDNLGIEMTEDDAMDYGIGSYQPQAQGWDYMYDGKDEGWSGPTPGRSAQERWE